MRRRRAGDRRRRVRAPLVATLRPTTMRAPARLYRERSGNAANVIRLWPMFVGHFAVGLAAKRLAPKASLPVLLAAPQFLDILFPVMVLSGAERVNIVPG